MPETTPSPRPPLSGGTFRGIVVGLFLIPWTVIFGFGAMVAGWIRSAVLHREDVRFWSRGILFMSGTKIELTRSPRLDPQAQYVFLSNHQSALDIPILITATSTHDIRFMAKESLFKIPFLGWGLSGNGYVPINRDSARQAAERFQELLDKKSPFSYLIFPEGTRSPDGRLQPLKRGTLGLALRLGLPVVPVTVIDACRANPKDSYQIRPGTVRVVIHDPIAFDANADRTTRDALLEQVQATIASALPDEQKPADTHRKDAETQRTE